MEHSLGEAGVTTMATVGSEAGGTLVALGKSPLGDTRLTEITTTTGDTVRIMGDKLGEGGGGMIEVTLLNNK